MASLDYKYIAALVSRAQSGDSDAFAELYAATYQRQYYFSCRYLKDEYLAQDALQETYILAFKNLTKLKDPDLVIAWLNQINFRVCYNLHQKQKRYNSELNPSDEQIDSLEADILDLPTSSGTYNPEDSFIRIESKEYIMNQILKLPFTESQVILLKYYQSMKHDEIAKLMDISRSSVKRYLQSGRERLAQVLRP